MKPTQICWMRFSAPVLFVSLVLLGTRPATVHASDLPDQETLRRRGEVIYQESCADCHGAKGEGVKNAYDEPLVGDDSVGELAKLISATMPDGDSDSCVGEDADAVAAYIHHAFYSEAARIRNRPPRVMLTHLTGNQLRQSLSDLYSHFSGSMWIEPKRGLNALYFDGARYKRENQKIERVDRMLDFDWQHDGPGEGIKPEDFYVHWRGGLKVDETGRYEIVIRSTCAFICKLGSFDREFINNRVQSGDKTEFRKAITLTAGRVVPIQIELYQRKRKTEQPPASISLSWVAPGGTEVVIPEQNLVAASPPAVFLLQTKLPPDDRSYGYDRGLSVDRQWDESTTAAAVEFAQAAVDELWPAYRRKRKEIAEADRARLRSFLNEVAEVAFRGPLAPHEQTFYIDQQVDQTEDDSLAIKRSVLVMLKSPRFLYPTLDQDRSPSQRAANRLALTLFDSLPADKWLLDLIREDKLTSEDQIRDAARRMIKDYRTRGKVRELMYEWLNLTHHGELTKDEAEFPNFTAELVTDLKTSLDAFLDDVIWSEGSDFRQLYQADWAYTTQRLQEYYGDTWKALEADSDSETHPANQLVKTQADAAHRAGILTHPYLMASLAYPDSTSPIHRGVFLIRYMLGRTLRPPQEAFTPLSPDLHPEMTTRERVELQTSPQSCQVCHTKINALGFALENFDAVGRFRTEERNKPVNTTGRYTTRQGESVTFYGASELAKFLVNSDDAHRAFVNRAFQHLVKQPVAAFGADRLTQLTEQFSSDGFHIQNLLIEIAVIAASNPTSTPEEES